MLAVDLGVGLETGDTLNLQQMGEGSKTVTIEIGGRRWEGSSDDTHSSRQ